MAAIGAEKRTSFDEFIKRAGYIRVDLKIGQANHLLALGKANGKKMVCMIDTGCPENVIDAERAPHLREGAAREEPVYGAIGKVADQTRLGELDRFELGGVMLTNMAVAIASINKRPNEGQWIERYDVILGLDYLTKLNALISYRSPCLYVRKEPPDARLADVIKKSLVAGGFSAVPLHGLEDHVLLVDALVNSKAARLRLDTGGSSTLLDREQLSAYGIGEQQIRGEMQDLSANRVVFSSTRVVMQIGNVEIKKLPVGTVKLPGFDRSNARLKKEGKPELLGLLGAEFLFMSSAVIDSKGACMYLVPPPE